MKVNVRRKPAVMLLIGSVVLSIIIGVNAWRPKCKYAFGGSWLYVEDGGDIVTSTESPYWTGKRWCGTVGEILAGSDPALFGFPGAKWSIDWGEYHSTGKYTFAGTHVCYLKDASNNPIWIVLADHRGEWIDGNTREIDHLGYIYLADSDGDGDGYPDDLSDYIGTPIPLHYVGKRMPVLDMPTAP